MIGTLINVLSVVLGSTIGLLFHKNLPEKIVHSVFQVIGLFTLALGVSMAIKAEQILLMIFSLVIGTILGTLVNLDEKLQRLSTLLQNTTQSKNEKFSEGMITAFLLFCMGSMTILGAFEEGLGGKPNLLLAKSVLDGFSSVALASGMGIGVMFSAIPLLFFQGGLALLATFLEQYFTDAMINELTATGGILLLGLGLNILEIKKIRMMNMLPSLLIIVILTLIFVK
ncbi:MAG: DUF554 domain-containing protein [Candidatus Marinimicrobia bacterium]|nr:DUF554 domain-containing protein [Candidatus Neomarinimicrobiota bacterium]